MTPTEWLKTIWRDQPVTDLPPEPEGYDLSIAERLGWIRRDADGWRVADNVPKLFGWE